MTISKPIQLEKYILKENAKIHLLEYVDEKYVNRIHSDIQTFLKNINRVKDYESFIVLLEYYFTWYNNEFETFLNVFTGKSSLSDYEEFMSHTIAGKQITRLIKALDSLFVVDEKDLKKYLNKGSSLGGYALQVSLVVEYKDSKKIKSFNESDLEEYFAIWKINSASRYVSTKKIVDDVFSEIDYEAYLQGKSAYSNTNEVIERYGVKIQLVYVPEVDSLRQQMYDLVKTVESALSYFSKKSYGKKLLPSLKIIIDVISKKTNYKFDTSYGSETVGGLYRLTTGEILLGNVAATDDVIVILAHELGHKYYYEVLNASQRQEWEQYFTLLTQTNVEGIKSQLVKDYNIIQNTVDTYKKDLFSLRNSTTVDKDLKDLQKQYYMFTSKDAVANFFMEQFWNNDLAKHIDYTEDAQQKNIYASKLLNDYLYKEKGSLNNYPLYNTVENKEMDTGVTSPIYLSEFSQYVFDTLYTLLPKDSKDLSQLPTRYAGENASEFFAEVFAANAIKSMNIGATREYKLLFPVLDEFQIITGLREKSIVESKEFINTSWLEKHYKLFNKLYFDNELGEYPIVVKNLKGRSAYVESFGIKSKPETWKIQKMVFSPDVILSEDESKGILAHEMIHIYLIEKQQEEVGGQHGVYFLKELRRLNSITPFEVPLEHDITYKKLDTDIKGKPVVVVMVSDAISVYNYKIADSVIEGVKTLPERWIEKYHPTIYISDDNELQKYPVKTKFSSKTFGSYETDKDLIQRIIDNGELIYQF